jgi:hypothetical protein
MPRQILQETQAFDTAYSHASARLHAAEPQSSTRWGDPASACAGAARQGAKEPNRLRTVDFELPNHSCLNCLDFGEPF